MTKTPPAISFRDPSGRVVVFDGRVMRWVNQSGQKDLRAFLHSQTIKNAVAEGHAVATRPLDLPETEHASIVDILGLHREDLDSGNLVEHDKIPFPNYPYEWPPEMLHAAAGLTLDLQAGLLEESLGLKDASAYNILFDAWRPVFIDALSVEARDPHDPAWVPEAQFSRMFLLPLLAARDLGLPLSVSLSAHRDGLPPETVHTMTPRLRRLRTPYRWLVTLPTWLASKAEKKGETLYRKRTLKNPDHARYVARSVVKRLRKQLRQVEPRDRTPSAWSGYMEDRGHYSKRDAQKKDHFVRRALDESRPGWVLDIGCNTGHHSAMAAEGGARVVAIDQDPGCVGQTWRRAKSNQLDILPLVVDLARPSPAMGWRNQEHPSFLERATGRFDTVMMLAVVHHMQVTERIPLQEILGLAKQLTRDHVVLEFVGPDDPMFRRLLRGRQDLHQDHTREAFEDLLEPHFGTVAAEGLTDTDRVLYHLRRKDATSNDPAPDAVSVATSAPRPERGST